MHRLILYFIILAFQSSVYSQIGHNGHIGIGFIEVAPQWRCISSTYPEYQPAHNIYTVPCPPTQTDCCSYSIRKLYTIAYWRHCNANSDPNESYYWFRMWNNPNSGSNADPVLCCDHNHSSGESSTPGGPTGPSECHITDLLDITLVDNTAAYIQFDLYSQCTSCSDLEDSGSWWSSKGNNPNPSPINPKGLFTASQVSNYLIGQGQFVQNQDPIFCIPLSFVTSPDCDCKLDEEYGCSIGDQH